MSTRDSKEDSNWTSNKADFNAFERGTTKYPIIVRIISTKD